jgi:hypothetical protein
MNFAIDKDTSEGCINLVCVLDQKFALSLTDTHANF